MQLLANVLAIIPLVLYFSSKSFFMYNGYYGLGTGQIIANDLRCDGSETDIGHCSATWWPGTNSLTHSDDVGISCDGRKFIVIVYLMITVWSIMFTHYINSCCKDY